MDRRSPTPTAPPSHHPPGGPAAGPGAPAAPAPAEYVLEDSFGYLVNQASRSIRRRFDEELAARRLGVTGEQFAVLVHLWRLDGQHQKDLAATLAKDKTTMARLVQGLEARGMVVRAADLADLRYKRVHLSEQGRAEMAGLLNAATAVLEEVARIVDPRELAVCEDVLRAVHRGLSASSDDVALGDDESEGGTE